MASAPAWCSALGADRGAPWEPLVLASDKGMPNRAKRKSSLKTSPTGSLRGVPLMLSTSSLSPCLSAACPNFVALARQLSSRVPRSGWHPAPQNPGRRDGRGLEGGQHLERVDVAEWPRPDGTADHVLGSVGAVERLHVTGADTGVAAAVEQDAEDLAHLEHVVGAAPVAPLEVFHAPGDPCVVPEVGGDRFAAQALLSDPEIGQFQPSALGDQDVHRSEVTVEDPTAMKVIQGLEEADDLILCSGFGPPARLPQVDVHGPVGCVLEDQGIVEETFRPSRQTERERVKEFDDPPVAA